MEVNKEELRRLAEAFPKTEITSASAAAMLKLWIDLASPAAILSLLDENDRLLSTIIMTSVRHFSFEIKDRTDDRKLDECLSEGISMLEDERDQLRAENERLRALLLEASEEIDSWGSYTSEYFQKKHDLPGAVAKFHDAAMAKEVDNSAH